MNVVPGSVPVNLTELTAELRAEASYWLSGDQPQKVLLKAADVLESLSGVVATQPETPTAQPRKSEFGLIDYRAETAKTKANLLAMQHAVPVVSDNDRETLARVIADGAFGADYFDALSEPRRENFYNEADVILAAGFSRTLPTDTEENAEARYWAGAGCEEDDRG